MSEYFKISFQQVANKEQVRFSSRPQPFQQQAANKMGR